MKIYIGHDTRHKKATLVCQKSIKNHNPNLKVAWLDKSKLRKIGAYGRKDLPGESTEFSFTRFYVPLLMHYRGIAIFCDNDFVWKCDPMEIVEYMRPDDAIAVVQHKDYDIKETKMDGVKNKQYPRKNWSSLIVFNCAKLKHMTKEYLDNATASHLHELKWVDDIQIGNIPDNYNVLVGTHDPKGAKALHYTNGGPWFDEYKNAELSEEWWKIYESL
tara:strand:- start:1322 stop:1972 length:651 start_codon:yes stop_codon:yes gene_type:complete